MSEFNFSKVSADVLSFFLTNPPPPTLTPTVGPSPISALSYDWSAQYLAVCGGCKTGSTVTIRTAKELTEIASLGNAHSKAVTGVAWGADAAFLATSSLDKTVKIHSC